MNIDEAIKTAGIPLECDEAEERIKDFARTCISALEKQKEMDAKLWGGNLTLIPFRVCPKCDKILRENDRYCPQCGQKIKAE